MDVLKENKEFWLYVLGIIVLFFIFLWIGSFFLRGEYFGIGGGNQDDQNQVPNTFSQPPTFTIDASKDYTVEFETNYGKFKVDLYERNAPNNVNNFVFLASAGYFDKLTVHRMIKDLLIQSGSRATQNDDPTDDDLGNPGYTVRDEINWDSLDLTVEKRAELTKELYESNLDVSSKRLKKYSLVMANAGKPNSAGSQFFIITGEDADPRVEFLRGRHTVIGEVVEGKDVIDKIRGIEVVEDSNFVPRPKDTITFESVVVKVQ